MKRRAQNIANSIVDGELLLLLGAVSLIVLPGAYAWNATNGWPGPLVLGALGVMAFPWLLRLLLTGAPSKSTILDAPLAFLLLAMGLGLWVSTSPAVTLRQIIIMVAGIAVFYAIVNRLRDAASVWVAAVVVIICGALLASALLVQFAWMRGAHTLMPMIQRLGIAQAVTAETSAPWLEW